MQHDSSQPYSILHLWCWNTNVPLWMWQLFTLPRDKATNQPKIIAFKRGLLLLTFCAAVNLIPKINFIFGRTDLSTPFLYVSISRYVQVQINVKEKSSARISFAFAWALRLCQWVHRRLSYEKVFTDTYYDGACLVNIFSTLNLSFQINVAQQ